MLVLAQPVLGFLNIFFAARPHSRRMVSLAHKIVALLIIVGGLVTGLLGFVLTAHTTGIIILAILASVMAVCASTIELCAMRSRKQATRLPLPLSPTLDPLEYAQDKGRGWQ